MQKLKPSRLEALCWRLKKKCACQCCWKLGIWCWKFHIWWLFQNAMQLGKKKLVSRPTVGTSKSALWLSCRSHMKFEKPRKRWEGPIRVCKKAFLFRLEILNCAPCPMCFFPSCGCRRLFDRCLEALGQLREQQAVWGGWTIGHPFLPVVRFTINHPQALTNNSWLWMGCMLTIPKWVGIDKMKLYHIKQNDFLYLRAYFDGLWPDWCF